MTAHKRKRAKMDLRGYEKNGSKVVAATTDQEQFRVACKCGEVYTADRAHVRRSRTVGRNLHCYECSCRNYQVVAAKAAAGRARVGGMFV